jgi:protein-L-isoaspartate(D-aspartate) O-methyltransferase
MTDFKAERAAMIESQIRPNGVTDVRLLEALYQTPRETFVPPSLRSLAYMDGPLRVESAHDGRPARYLLAPMTFAKLVQLARVKAEDKVLDVGPATGYSTAILARLASKVVAVECDAGLLAVAKDALESQQISGVKTVANALADGAPEHAPFDVVFVNGRLTDAPERLLGQLAPGGRLVAVIGSETSAKATLFTKIDETIQAVIDFDSGGPVLPGFEKKVEFAF